VGLGTLGAVRGEGYRARRSEARTGRHGAGVMARSRLLRRQRSGGQASYTCGRGRAVLGRLGKKRRLERWRDHHAREDMQGRRWQEEPHKSGEMMHGGVKMVGAVHGICARMKEGRTPEGYILVCLATSAQVKPFGAIFSADGARIEEGVRAVRGHAEVEAKLEGGRKDTPGEDG